MPDSWSFIMWVRTRVCLRERKRDIYFECVCVSVYEYVGMCVSVWACECVWSWSACCIDMCLLGRASFRTEKFAQEYV